MQIINQRSLKCLSVTDCFSRFAWQGEQAPLLPLVAESRPKSWRTTCVQDFFQTYNWSGRTIAPIDTPEAPIQGGFSLRLSVEQFFNYFVWAGQPEIAPQPTQPKTTSEPSPNHDFKLSNFSNLF